MVAMYIRKSRLVYGSVGELVIIMHFFFFFAILQAHLLFIISFDLLNSLVRLLGANVLILPLKSWASEVGSTW